MNALFKKLNFKNHKNVLVLNHPDSFDAEIKEMLAETSFLFNADDAPTIDFAIIFVSIKQEIEESMASLSKKLTGDFVLWFCYPKGTSKKYTCNFNRDTGWKVLGEYGLEPVRQVSIDDDWSALRFRKVECIKNMSRNENATLTKEGKLKASKNTNKTYNHNQSA